MLHFWRLRFVFRPQGLHEMSVHLQAVRSQVNPWCPRRLLWNTATVRRWVVAAAAGGTSSGWTKERICIDCIFRLELDLPLIHNEDRLAKSVMKFRLAGTRNKRRLLQRILEQRSQMMIRGLIYVCSHIIVSSIYIYIYIVPQIEEMLFYNFKLPFFRFRFRSLIICVEHIHCASLSFTALSRVDRSIGGDDTEFWGPLRHPSEPRRQNRLQVPDLQVTDVCHTLHSFTFTNVHCLWLWQSFVSVPRKDTCSNKRYLQFWILIVAQSKFTTSELANIIAQLSKFCIKVCVRSCSDQGTAVREMAAPLPPRPAEWSASCGLTKINELRRAQRRHYMEFGVDPNFKLPIYVFFKQLCERGCLCKRKVSFAAKCMDGTGILPWNAYELQIILYCSVLFHFSLSVD
jgi:hypothetical protein